MKILFVSVIIFQCIYPSITAPVSPLKGVQNGTKIEDEVAELHTLISETNLSSTENKMKEVDLNRERKISEVREALKKLQLQKEKLESPQTFSLSSQPVKRNLQKMPNQRDIAKSLYRDGTSSEDINEYDRTEDWPLDSAEDTSRDMAEYIFWTGDEISVTQAIKDFIKQGMLSPNEAISFLEDVRNHLKRMQIRYGVLDNVSQPMESRHVPEYLDDNQNKVAFQPEMAVPPMGMAPEITNVPVSDESDDLSLREMLYQMGKIFFRQSIKTEGARDTEKALHSLAQYLDDETNTGRISEQVKAQILEVLFASLVDAVNENGELSHSNLKGGGGRQE
ncbi:uncharacterized protein LOC136041065 [Artemia franciscana]|uniref:uncharacterized protein LOC136041065 n=1 Tax=Artemia franciscana TaxID=6661 RepID=UPI0032DAA970